MFTGGIGTFVNADYIAAIVTNAQVKASPQGGWFFPNVSTYIDWHNGQVTVRNYSQAVVRKPQNAVFLLDSRADVTSVLRSLCRPAVERLHGSQVRASAGAGLSGLVGHQQCARAACCHFRRRLRS
jgi:hypothetical protein